MQAAGQIGNFGTVEYQSGVPIAEPDIFFHSGFNSEGSVKLWISFVVGGSFGKEGPI